MYLVVPNACTHVGLSLDQRVDKIEMAISLVADRVEDIVRKLIAVEERKVDALEYENRIKFQVVNATLCILAFQPVFKF